MTIFSQNPIPLRKGSLYKSKSENEKNYTVLLAQRYLKGKGSSRSSVSPDFINNQSKTSSTSSFIGSRSKSVSIPNNNKIRFMMPIATSTNARLSESWSLMKDENPNPTCITRMPKIELKTKTNESAQEHLSDLSRNSSKSSEVFDSNEVSENAKSMFSKRENNSATLSELKSELEKDFSYKLNVPEPELLRVLEDMS